MDGKRLPRVLQRARLIACLIVTPLLLMAAVLIVYQYQADASSHREAPLISKDPFADNTDVYAFISPENSDNIVLIASWIPFEGPEGGPNYFEWDDNVRYDIYVDNDGDAKPEFTYTLSSKVRTVNPDTFLYNTAPINSIGSSAWNRRQYITVTETTGQGSVTDLVTNKATAPVNIGSKSTPNYDALEQAAFHTADNGMIKVFAGQTDDPFWVDLQVFDLLTLRGQNAPIGYDKGNNIPVDSVSGFNVHSLVLEVPISRLKQGNEPVLGVWAGSRRKTMSIAESQTNDYRQVSRLGMPLVNEVVLPLALKDVFNGLRPEQDLGAYTLLQKSVENPEVGTLLCQLYGVPLPGDSDKDCSTEFIAATPRSGRGDIFDIFLTGMKLQNAFTITTQNGPVTLPAGFNVNQPANVVPAEMIRINTDIKGETCSPTSHRLGVLGGDACGFPNGRRLTDDIVEIELLAVAGAAYEVLDDRDASFAFNPALSGVLDDGVDHNDRPFRTTFPYLAQAQSGQQHWHQNPIVALFLPFITKTALALQIVPNTAHAHAVGAVATVLLLGLPALVLWRRQSQ